MPPTEKRCLKCSIIKPLSEFWAQPAGKFGRTSRCMECGRAEHKAYKERMMPPSVKEARTRKQSLFTQGLKECPSCRDICPMDAFYKGKGSCKTCEMARHREWKRKNLQHMFDYVRDYTSRPEVSAKKRERNLFRRTSSPRITMQITLRHGLKRRPTENPATIDDLMEKWRAQEGRCAITGIAMTWGQGRVLPASISLDRIDPNGGYSSDNLRLICHAVNAFKGRMSDDEMLAMAEAIVINMKKPKLRLVASSEPTWQNFHHFTESAL